MKAKELIAVAGVLIALGFAYSYASGARADAVAAEERVHVLEAERMELERQVEEAVQGYDLLVDSLAQAHDSLAEVRAEAVVTASEAASSFERGFDVLRDSLGAYDGLVEILDQAQADHQEEVTAYQVQIQTLEADKVLLFQRVTVLDSLWVLEQDIGESLRAEIGALHEEADAWQRLSNTSFLSGLRGVAPYALAGAGIVLLSR
jgi:chromosome segregation ATPase|tara:strand:- start:785 stop:1399 length:615 start_codon:yes stop_codon:yes gene_type:complete